jgi:probable rRNA maturation factor
MVPPERVGGESQSAGIEIHVNGLDEWPDLVGLGDAIVGAARTALGANPKLAEGELSISLVDDLEIARLNREWLEHSGATDVIAFSLGSVDAVLGDIYIAPATASRNATRLGVDLREEILRLVIHGTLHVVGWDHPEGPDRDASEMYRMQEELLRSLEIR